MVQPPEGIHRARETRTVMATTITMTTRATTPDLAMRHITHITVKRLTMFWAIPSHITVTRVGASGDS